MKPIYEAYAYETYCGKILREKTSKKLYRTKFLARIKAKELAEILDFETSGRPTDIYFNVREVV